MEPARAHPQVENGFSASELQILRTIGNAVRVQGAVLILLALVLATAIVVRLLIAGFGVWELYAVAVAVGLTLGGLFCLAAGRELQTGRDPLSL